MIESSMDKRIAIGIDSEKVSVGALFQMNTLLDCRGESVLSLPMTLHTFLKPLLCTMEKGHIKLCQLFLVCGQVHTSSIISKRISTKKLQCML